MGTGGPLIVPDARKDELWKRNPDIKLGMVSYIGYPICWPDGEVFGNLCVLENKENPYSKFSLLNPGPVTVRQAHCRFSVKGVVY